MLLARCMMEEQTGFPPVIEAALVKEEARTIDVQVDGIPAGHTVARVLWTVKVSAADPDPGVLQKDCTAASSLATIGQITDDGTDGTAVVRIQITATDFPDTLGSALVHQLWAVLDDGRQGCVATGTIALSAPIPFTLP